MATTDPSLPMAGPAMIMNNNSATSPQKIKELAHSDTPTPEALMAALDENQPFYTRQGENYVCSLCDKSFNYKNGLIRHLRLTHGKEKPFECNICHRRFGYKNILMEHQNIHFGIKPYACSLCDKRFAARSNLVQHKLVHRKPFSCTICTKRFDKPEQLQRHLLGHPGGYLSCNICNFSTVNQAALNEHMQKNHPPQVLNTREKGNSFLDSNSIMDTSKSPTSSAQKGPLPQFGVAFNFAKGLSNQQGMTSLQGVSSSSLSSQSLVQPSSEAQDSIRRIDSICAQLATKNPTTSLPEFPAVSRIKQEPMSPHSDCVVSPPFQNQDFGSLYGHQPAHSGHSPFPAYHSGYQNQANRYSPKGNQGNQLNSLPSPGSSVINIEAAQTTTHTSYRNTDQQADSTSNLSDVLSVLQSLAQQSADSDPGNFPQISITISPAKHNADKSIQCVMQNPNAPGLQETLAYYESQGQLYRCQHCRIIFEERGLYFLHMALHGSPNPWQCSICYSVFLDRNDFHLHLINQQHCQK